MDGLLAEFTLLARTVIARYLRGNAPTEVVQISETLIRALL
ncbi:hypothetical protein ACLBWY_00715 [Enterobacteriaceae bacterium C34L]